MNKLFFLIYILGISTMHAQDFTTEFEKSNGLRTATYHEVMSFYNKLEKKYPEISIHEFGQTDSGNPLHLIVFNSNIEFELSKSHTTNKPIILINNGIHPGEPDGIDASMMLMRDIVQNESLKRKYSDIIIGVIPIYNIGGSLNRNSTSRVNQNGPETYGFRGNARNFDLNRDFIKNDTRNSKSFAEIYQTLNPDVFIDNHVSNGADYQYTLTHLFTQHNKLGGELGDFLQKEMLPEIERELTTKNLDITPYVNVFNRVPDEGFSQFFDSPRYSTGYTTLFGTLGFMVETHMLKNYPNRVNGTYEIMVSTLNFLTNNGHKIKSLRKNSFTTYFSEKKYPIQWEIDSSKTSTLQFKGYEGKYVKSEVTGLKRLKYDKSKPFNKPITYYNYFKPKRTITIPKAYIIPKGWWKVIERLNLNQIEYTQIQKDTLIKVETYKINNYETMNSAYEGHYLHYNTQVDCILEFQKINKGDLYISTNQKGIRYLLETLEPEAKDSFFNWNFFDTILQKKEHFSPYIFEDLALDILNENPKLKTSFEKKKNKDTDFSNNWYAQLNYIYIHSKYNENSYLKYPIYRVPK